MAAAGPRSRSRPVLPLLDPAVPWADACRGPGLARHKSPRGGGCHLPAAWAGRCWQGWGAGRLAPRPPAGFAEPSSVAGWGRAATRRLSLLRAANELILASRHADPGITAVPVHP